MKELWEVSAIYRAQMALVPKFRANVVEQQPWNGSRRWQVVSRRVIGGNEVARCACCSSTAKQRLARKNELKARGTLLMALPDKHQLKFNIHKDAKTLMEEIEKRFGGNKETKKVQKTLLRQQYENFTCSSSESTDEPVSVVASVSAASAKILVFDLPNVDTLSNAVIYSFFASQSNSPQLNNDDLKQIDADDLMANSHVDCERKVISSEDRKESWSKWTYFHGIRYVKIETSTSNALVSQCDGVGSYDWSFQVEEEPTNYALMAFTSSSSSSSDNKVASCSKACTKAYATLQSHYGTFMPPKPDLVFYDAPNVNETAHTAFNVELSPTKPDKYLSYTHRASAPIIKDWGGKISGKGKIRTGKLYFDDVYFVKELKFNLFSVSQLCDKKNIILFTDTKCIVLSLEFKLPNENQVLLRVPRESNMYNVDLKNIVPSGDLTCLFAKATLDESDLWHRKLGHIIFKTMNKLVKDDYSRFTWVFFLATKDETSPILKTFITGIKNQLSLKVKIIRSDNGTEFKNNDLNQFCGMNGIKREFSVPRTPQQNGIAERKNRTLIEAARTMLADSLLPIPFWAEAVNTTCYVQNRVLVTKPQNKTPYKLLLGRTPSIGFMRHFGCPITILNTLDPLGSGPTWLFDIDTLTKTINYQPVTAGNQSNSSAGVQEQFNVEKAGEENVQQYVLFPLWSFGSKNPQNTDDDATFREFEDFYDNNINKVNAADSPVSAEEIYVYQPPRFEDPDYPDKVYKVVKALYELHQAPRACQDQYVAEILRKFGLTDGKLASILIDTEKPLLKDPDELSRMGYEKPSTKLTFYKAFFLPQWKFLIYTILQCVSAKRTAWNEFSSSMASAIVCLSTGMIVAQQADDVADEGAAVIPTPPSLPIVEPSSPPQQQQPSQSTHDATISLDLLHTLLETCTTLTRKVEALEQDKVVQALEIIKLKQKVKKLERKNKLKVSGLRRLRKVGTAQRVESSADIVMDNQEDTSKQGEIIANIDADEDVTLKDVAYVKKDAEIEENANVQGRLADAIITAATTPITAAPSAARMRKGVVIRDLEKTGTPSIIIHIEPKSKDKGKGIMVEEPKPLKKQAQIEQDEAYAREKCCDEVSSIEEEATDRSLSQKEHDDLSEEYAGFKMDYFKGMSYDDMRPIFDKYFNSNVAFLEKSKEQLEEEASRALKRASESQAKKQKLDEEVEELKKHLQIVPNDEDDVYTEAIPLAHKPKNFSDDFMLTTLTYMFEKPDVQAQVWKNKRSVNGLAKVKSWRLLESYRVHIIIFTTTQMILLVERRYPLTRFTLDRMLNNVRLEVEEESEVSFELLRFVRQQRQEGFKLE
nr:ribonuclease H-like domain-containing protein [Tanacetum cinerariifolium]